MNRILTTMAIVFLGNFYSCKDKPGKPVDFIKTSIEMQKVLSHYKSEGLDSLGYKAALFLIQNMDGRYSYAGDQYQSFLNFIDSVSVSTQSIEDYKEHLSQYAKDNGTLVGILKKKFDSETLSSQFIIDNIDKALIAYKSAPWCKDMGFEEFCEYVLPYRIGNEPIENFRDSFFAKFKFLLKDSTLNRQEAADSILKITSQKSMDIIAVPSGMPDLPVSTLKVLRGGTCRESSNLAIYIMRSMGIPVADDFTPQWPHRGLGHSWTALYVNKDSCIDFEGATSSKVGGHLRALKSFRIAKAFRHTFSKQSSGLAIQHGSEPIPAFFDNPYIKDVSNMYFKGVNISVKLNSKGNKRFGYLCVFNNRKWVPIQWAKISYDSATFERMGKSVVYLPAIYHDGEIDPLTNNPIVVDSLSRVKVLIPDEQNLQTIVLRRKYPVFDWWNTRTMAMKGGRFQASRTKEFSNSVDIYRIDEIPEMTYQDVEIKESGKYKFWRYFSPDSSYGDVAEIEFYDGEKKLTGDKIIGSEGNSKTRKKEAAFDEDPLTFFQSDIPNGNWVGVSFPEAKRITRIRYLCRNDDNFIRLGDKYELLYWFSGNWKSLGTQFGNNSQKLIYEKAPTNALFLLRNLTRGKEERIFTYVNGIQSWW